MAVTDALKWLDPLPGELEQYIDDIDMKQALIQTYNDMAAGFHGDASFSVSGRLVVLAGSPRWYNPTNRVIPVFSARASVGTAPQGGDIIVQLLRDSVPITTLTILAGYFTSGRIVATTPVTLGVDQYVTINVTQVGSTNPGADLVVQIEY